MVWVLRCVMVWGQRKEKKRDGQARMGRWKFQIFGGSKFLRGEIE